MTSMWTSMQLCNRALGRRRTVAQQREAEEHDAWFREQVQVGVASANAGELVPNEEVESRFAARRADTRRRHEILP